jgi:hypothetical protein
MVAHLTKRRSEITAEEWRDWDWLDVTAMGDVTYWEDWDNHRYVRGLPHNDDGQSRMTAGGEIVRRQTTGG